MDICVDFQAAVTQTAGVGRYTRRLMEHLGPLAAAGNSGSVGLFYFDFRRTVEPPRIPGTRARPFRALPGRCMHAVWRFSPYPDFATLAGPADLYHFPNFTMPPLRHGRSIITIHDLSFMRFPQYAEPRNLRRLQAAIPRSLARANAILTISNFSAAEIAKTLAVDPERIHVTPLGVDSNFQPADPAAISAMRAALGLERPYLLTVGTVEPRKNHPFLADVLESLDSAYDGCLAIAGAPGWRTESILQRMRRSPRAADIRLLSHVPESLLPSLYSGADAFLFPSFYEGFGFPPLEALACGTPVISSDGGALAEILDTPAVIRPGILDADRWVTAVRDLLRENDTQRAIRRDTGRQHAARYRWDDTARRTWDVYRSVLA